MKKGFRPGTLNTKKGMTINQTSPQYINYLLMSPSPLDPRLQGDRQQWPWRYDGMVTALWNMEYGYIEEQKSTGLGLREKFQRRRIQKDIHTVSSCFFQYHFNIISDCISLLGTTAFISAPPFGESVCHVSLASQAEPRCPFHGPEGTYSSQTVPDIVCIS